MNIFICTKPLQIIIAMIICNNNNNNNTIYVTKTFYNSDKIANSYILKKYFVDVKFFTTRNMAIRYASKKKPDKLYIDSDIGLKTQKELILFKIFNQNSAINVYEEGIGTYRNNIILSKFKKTVYKITGSATTFGGSILTSKIYVFDKNKYIKNNPNLSNKAIQIDQNFYTWIKKNQRKLSDLFPVASLDDNKKHNDYAYMYLSDWNIDQSIIDKISMHKNVYIKPHPHLQYNQIDLYIKKYKSLHWIDAHIPAELAILKLSMTYNKLFIIHNNSSAFYYMKNIKNIYEAK